MLFELDLRIEHRSQALTSQTSQFLERILIQCDRSPRRMRHIRARIIEKIDGFAWRIDVMTGNLIPYQRRLRYIFTNGGLTHIEHVLLQLGVKRSSKSVSSNGCSSMTNP